MKVLIFFAFTIFYFEYTTVAMVKDPDIQAIIAPMESEQLSSTFRDEICNLTPHDNTTACSLCDAYCPNRGSQDKTGVSCVDNSQCSSHTTCLVGYCNDPCLYFHCPENTECTTYNHIATCITEHKCTLNEECPNDMTCLSKRCEDLCASYKCGGDLTCKIFDHKIACVHKRRYHPETNKKLNFNQAMEFCLRRGLRLAEFDTEDEYNQLVALLRNIKIESMDSDGMQWYYGFLLGGSDLRERDTWIWTSSGSLVTFKKWASSQPDHRTRNNDTEHCIELQPAYNYRMNDVSCYLASNFVCEDITMA